MLPYYNTSGGNATAFYYQPPVPNGGVQQESTFSWTGFMDVRVDNWYLYFILNQLVIVIILIKCQNKQAAQESLQKKDNSMIFLLYMERMLLHYDLVSDLHWGWPIVTWTSMKPVWTITHKHVCVDVKVDSCCTPTGCWSRSPLWWPNQLGHPQNYFFGFVKKLGIEHI